MKTIWDDKCIFPYKFGFCPSEQAWKSTLKYLGVKPEPYPMKGQTGACVTHFTAADATAVTNKCDFSIVTADDFPASDVRCTFLASMLVHEATHIWQQIKKAMGERDPSSEFEAYMVQNVSLFLFDAYAKTRGSLFRKSRGR